MNAKAVWDFISNRLRQGALEAFVPYLEKELHQHGGLVLLDGLDEVPDALDRRRQIKQAVQDFAATFSKCRFLVTSRTYAYQRQDWKLDNFVEVHLLPFTPGQIAGFVDAWYAHIVQLYRLTAAEAGGTRCLVQRLEPERSALPYPTARGGRFNREPLGRTAGGAGVDRVRGPRLGSTPQCTQAGARTGMAKRHHALQQAARQ